jgi:hypothetical protein
VQAVRAACFVPDVKLSTGKQSAQPLVLDRMGTTAAACDRASTRQFQALARRHKSHATREPGGIPQLVLATTPTPRCAVHLQHTARHTRRMRSDGGAHIKAVAA